MKVWWCGEHLCGNLPNSDMEDWPSPSGQGDVCLWAEEFGSETKCRMVEMQLVPADARMMPANISWLHPEHRNPDWPSPGPDDGLPGSGQVRLIVVPYTWDGQQWVESFEMPVEEPPKDPWDYDP